MKEIKLGMSDVLCVQARAGCLGIPLYKSMMLLEALDIVAKDIPWCWVRERL